MPSIIDYADVVQQFAAKGLQCVYPNSGAFAFPRGARVHVAAFVGPDDPTIRPEARQYVRQVTPPYEQTLANIVTNLWEHFQFSEVWLMPKSHWVYELDFGNTTWLAPALQTAGIDPAQLITRHDGSAICFDQSERNTFHALLQTMLTHLAGSDFLLTFPQEPIVCTIHHHKQLWWITESTGVKAYLDAREQ